MQGSRATSERESSSRWERRQRRIAALFLLLIPLAIPAGLFAPNFIAVMLTTDPYPGPDSDLDTARVELDHEPLRNPRHFPLGEPPPQTHTAKLAKLFRPAPPREEPIPSVPPPTAPEFTPFEPDPPSKDFANYDPANSDEIEETFDSLESQAIEEWPPEFFVAGLPGGAYTQPPAVPEPGTGVLLAAGLVALAVQRRSVRRARLRGRGVRSGS